MLIPRMNDAHIDKIIVTQIVTFFGEGPHKVFIDPNPLCSGDFGLD